MPIRWLWIILFLSSCCFFGHSTSSYYPVGSVKFKHGTIQNDWFSLFAKQEVQKGFDALALAKIDPKIVIDAADNNYGIGVLSWTFGDELPHLKEVLLSGKFTYVRFHLWDHTCYRGNRCPNSPWHPNSDGPIADRATRVAQFMAQFPNIRYGISPALEHDQKDARVVGHWFAIVEARAPKAELVCSAVSGTCPSKTEKGTRIYLEKHGNNSSAPFRSNDGNSLFDSNSVLYRDSGSVLVLGWFYELNLRFAGEKEFTPPLQRKCQPTYDLMAQAKLVLRPQTAPAPFPRDCQIQREIKAPEILKTNAESYCNKDPRNNRPLYISTIKGRAGNTMDLVDPRNNRIGCLRYYGPYTDNRLSRWYSGTCTSSTPVDYYRAAGEWAFIKRRVGGRVECTRFNTIRRLGTYR